jgi:hypothetical protein
MLGSKKLDRSTTHIQSTWVNDHLQITPTCLQWPLYRGPNFNFHIIKLPLNNDHLSTMATNFGSRGWSLYTSLTVGLITSCWAYICHNKIWKFDLGVGQIYFSWICIFIYLFCIQKHTKVVGELLLLFIKNSIFVNQKTMLFVEYDGKNKFLLFLFK